MASPAVFFPCPMCRFRTSTHSERVSHLRLVHSGDAEFDVTCTINGCKNRYQNCGTFVTHVYRRHRDVILQSKAKKTVPGTPTNQDSPVHPHLECEPCGSLPVTAELQEESISLMHTVNHILGIDELEQKKKSALFILYLKEIKCLSETAVQDIISSYKSMLEHSVLRIQAGVNERLHSHGINPDDLNLAEIFSNTSNPFDGLSSVYMQERFYSEHLGCIVSISMYCYIYIDRDHMHVFQ